MEKQGSKSWTTAEIIGSAVDLLVRRGEPGGAMFVAQCYQLQRQEKFTPEEVSKLAARFVLNGEEVDDEEEERKWQDLCNDPKTIAALQRYAQDIERQVTLGEWEEGGPGIESYPQD